MLLWSRFVPTYFASKGLSLVTAFLCCSPEEWASLYRDARGVGVRMRAGWGASPALTMRPAPRREALVLGMACPNTAQLLRQASSSRAFSHYYSWLLVHDSTINSSFVEDALSTTAILPDADVTWLFADASVDVYRVKADQPLKLTRLSVDVSSSRQELDLFWARSPPAVVRRRNLDNVFIKSAVVVTQPQHFRGWDDYRDRQIDTFPKLTRPLLMLLAEDLHFRHDMRQTSLYGEARNGSFDGLAGMLQRGDVELGVASILMRTDRTQAMHYCSEIAEFPTAFMFRQPSQSAVSNMFVLPFSAGVWASVGGALTAASVALGMAAAAARRLPHADSAAQRLSPSEALTFALATTCQQGLHLAPSLLSARMVMLFSLLTSLFAFTAYSAKIVAILRSPSDSIRTVADLTHSPMALAVQETTYKKVYFAESKEPATLELYRRKLLPQGDRAYISVVEGIARVRQGMFAFQVELASGYEVISKTFTEQEKCDLKEIEVFKFPPLGVPLRRDSGYRELFADRVRWLRDTGLMSRARRVWLAGRASCSARGSGFVSARLRDVSPAVRALVAGLAAALHILLIEIIYYKLRAQQ